MQVYERVLGKWSYRVHPPRPIMYSYSPDSMPVIQVRLVCGICGRALAWAGASSAAVMLQAPPSKPLPEVEALLSKLEMDREKFETVS